MFYSHKTFKKDTKIIQSEIFTHQNHPIRNIHTPKSSNQKNTVFVVPYRALRSGGFQVKSMNILLESFVNIK